MKIDIIAAGRMRDKNQLALWADYVKRLQWSITLYEIDSKNDKEIEKLYLSKLDSRAFIFALDEKGKTLKSTDFATKINDVMQYETNHIQFLIGGADGHSQIIRKKANFLLSFGAQTWPHMLARIMLAEQIYRAQQILAGHPYHRE